jgi:uncharacterized protein YciI
VLYAIIGYDIENSRALRDQARQAHLARLRQLHDEGRVVLAGPFPGVDSPEPGEAGHRGSLIVAEFDSLESARAWADDDPYAHAGVYERVEVFPFKQTLPA